jgi:hypothetical protein
MIEYRDVHKNRIIPKNTKIVFVAALLNVRTDFEVKADILRRMRPSAIPALTTLR